MLLAGSVNVFSLFHFDVFLKLCSTKLKVKVFKTSLYILLLLFSMEAVQMLLLLLSTQTTSLMLTLIVLKKPWTGITLFFFFS